MPIPQTILRKDLVSLEPLQACHEEEIVATVRDPSVWTYMSFTDLSDESSVRTWFKGALEEPAKGTGTPFVIRHEESRAIIGSTSLYDINLRHQRCELGRTWLIPAFRRTGVNPRAKLLILEYAFDILAMQRVQLKASAGNTISRAAIESIGASFEGILRNFCVLPGGVRTDTVLYSITRDEWPLIKRRLLGRLH